MLQNNEIWDVHSFEYIGDDTDWHGFQFEKEDNWWVVLRKDSDGDWEVHPRDLSYDDDLSLYYSIYDLIEARCKQLERFIHVKKVAAK